MNHSESKFLGSPMMINLLVIALIAALWPVNKLVNQYIDPTFVMIGIVIGVNIILAVSLNLINGITGQFSLGHAGFMAIGAYAGGVLLKHFHPHGAALTALFPVMIVFGGVLAGIAGLIVGIPSLRLRGDYLAIATLGFGSIITVFINQIEHVGPFEVGGSAGLHGIPMVANIFWTYACVIVCVATIWRLVYSNKGKPFLAVREDEIAAAAMGVDTTYYKVAAFVIGAFFAGMAGVLWSTISGDLQPADMGFMESVQIVVMVVLGGSGSITGSILAAIVLTCLPEMLRVWEDWRMVIYSLILILMMLVRPEGLLGRREIWWTRSRRRLATE